MVNKIKKYTAFFAATLNIVASLFLIDSILNNWQGGHVIDPQNVSSSFGFIFFAASVVLWLVYLGAYILSRRKTK